MGLETTTGLYSRNGRVGEQPGGEFGRLAIYRRSGFGTHRGERRPYSTSSPLVPTDSELVRVPVLESPYIRSIVAVVFWEPSSGRYVHCDYTSSTTKSDSMSKYDDLFDEMAPDESLFLEKGALDPLTDPNEIHARDAQERELASLLAGVHEGYVPPTVTVYGPPGTGKTLSTRRVCREFPSRTDAVAVEYVNLKECQTLFSAANEILFELIGEKKGAYEGLDGVFEAIWTALEAYPEWTVLLDGIDHIRQDTNSDLSEVVY